MFMHTYVRTYINTYIYDCFVVCASSTQSCLHLWMFACVCMSRMIHRASNVLLFDDAQDSADAAALLPITAYRHDATHTREQRMHKSFHRKLKFMWIMLPRGSCSITMHCSHLVATKRDKLWCTCREQAPPAPAQSPVPVLAPGSGARMSPRHGLPPLPPSSRSNALSPRKQIMSPRSQDDPLSPTSQSRPLTFPLSPNGAGNQAVLSPRTASPPPWVQPNYSMTAGGTTVPQPSAMTARGYNNNGTNNTASPRGAANGPSWMFSIHGPPLVTQGTNKPGSAGYASPAPPNGMGYASPGQNGIGCPVSPRSNNVLASQAQAAPFVPPHQQPQPQQQAPQSNGRGMPGSGIVDSSDPQAKVAQWLSANLQHHQAAISQASNNNQVPTLSYV
jgi:hypothetical protein